jgi:hypothetical protein
VAALVAGEGNALHILLYGAVNYFINRAVMTQVYYLGTAALQYAAHNVDGSIMPVEQ